MAKTKEELNLIKKEYQKLTNKLKELTEDELKQVIGGKNCPIYDGSGSMIHEPTPKDVTIEGEINPTSTSGWFGTNN